MTQQQTAVAEQTVQTGSTPPAAPTGPKKKKRRSKGKLIAGLIVLAAVIVAVAVVLWYFVFRENNEKGAVLTDVVQIGSIQATVEGSGMTRARNSASVTPGTGTILELFVQEGDQVQEGQQLYRMDDTTAREAVTAAQKEVDNCTEELQKVYDKINQLTITAPHSGNLREVAGLKVGDTVNEGDTIATIVNDTKLRLSLYYSYAYENDIKVGQTAQISIPAIMGSRTGTVEKINKVRFVSPEGATHFEVVFVLDNPGTLTEGMEASAALTAGDGTPIYAYEGGTLKFYESTVVKAKASGPLEQFDLMNYGDVKAGQVMARLGAENTDEEITSKEEALKAAQEKLKTANDELGKYNATAPISGTVLSCSLTEGAEVQSGQGITIADTTKMVVEISVDERNARYVKTGMMVNIDQYGTPYMGVVESVSMTASGENGVASVPAVVTVDNIDGSMIPGTYVTYSFVASESDNCLVVPIQAVKDVTFDNVTLPDTLDAAPAEDGAAGERVLALFFGRRARGRRYAHRRRRACGRRDDRGRRRACGRRDDRGRRRGRDAPELWRRGLCPAADGRGGAYAHARRRYGRRRRRRQQGGQDRLGEVRRAAGERHPGARPGLGGPRGLLGRAGGDRAVRRDQGGDHPGPVCGPGDLPGLREPQRDVLLRGAPCSLT